MTSTYDVIVVGAGPTGTTVANLLALRGVRTVVVERNPGPGDDPRAISVAGETLRTMQTVGVMDGLAPESLLDTGSRYFGRNGQLIAEARPDAANLGHPGKSQIDQPVMERLLAEAFQARGELRFGTELTAVADDGETVTATVKDVDTGAEDTITASWLIACDGGRSPVRNMIGVALEGSVQEEKWIVIDVLDDPHTERFAEFHGDPRRPMVVVPGVKGRCRYEVMLFPGEDEEKAVSHEKISEYLAAHRPAVTPEQVRRAAVYTAHQRVAEHYRVGRVVLCGDASHLMPPFAGQGLNAGMRDATNLAWKIAEVVHGTADVTLVDTYEEERKPHVEEMVKVSVGIGRLVMTEQPRRALFRDIAVKALGALPALKSYVAGMRFVRPPHLTSGVVLAPDKALPAWARSAVGRSLPQPMVRDGHGTTTQLDELLGLGWSVVVVGGHPGDGSLNAARLAVAGTRVDAVHQIVAVGRLGEATDRDDVLVDVERYIATPETAGPAQRPVALLVRPDRYVAAACSPARLTRVIADLAPKVDLRVPATT